MNEILSILDWAKEKNTLITVLMLFIATWGFLNYSALKTTGESRKRRVQWITEKHFEEIYLDWLGYVLYRVRCWILGPDIKYHRGDTSVSKIPPKEIFHIINGPYSFDFTLKLAVTYPLLFVLAFWLLGGKGELAGLRILPEVDSLAARAILFLIISSILFGFIKSLITGGWKSWKSLLISCLALIISANIFTNEALISSAISVTMFGAILANFGTRLAGKFLFPYPAKIVIGNPGSLACGIATGGTISVGISYVLTREVLHLESLTADLLTATAIMIVIMMLGGVSAVAIHKKFKSILNSPGGKSRFLYFNWILLCSVSLLACYIFPQYTPNNPALTLIVFFGLLPLINAPIDWLSLNLSRTLLYSILGGHHRAVKGPLIAIFDFILALFFLLAVAIASTTTIAICNYLAVAAGARALVNLPELFFRLCDEPSHIDHWWIYAMLLSTLIPTIVHFMLAGGAATLAAPSQLRQNLAQNLAHEEPHKNDSDKFWGAWAYLTFIPFIGFILVPGALFYIGWLILPSHGETLMLWVLNSAQEVGGLIDPALEKLTECKALDSPKPL